MMYSTVVLDPSSQKRDWQTFQLLQRCGSLTAAEVFACSIDYDPESWLNYLITRARMYCETPLLLSDIDGHVDAALRLMSALEQWAFFVDLNETGLAVGEVADGHWVLGELMAIIAGHLHSYSLFEKADEALTETWDHYNVQDAPEEWAEIQVMRGKVRFEMALLAHKMSDLTTALTHFEDAIPKRTCPAKTVAELNELVTEIKRIKAEGFPQGLKTWFHR
jgi:hypothetical protein